MSSIHTSMRHTDAASASSDETGSHRELHPGQDLVDYAKSYAREKPEVVAMWCFGIGFILGWKLKPW